VKIYGQTFRQVFSQLPWPYKVVVAVGGVFVLFVLIKVPTILLQRSILKPPSPGPLEISAGTHASINTLDPSLAYDPATKTAWMAYTSQEMAGENGNLLHVRLASSGADPAAENKGRNCKFWSQSPGGIEGKRDDIVAPDNQTILRTGAWRAETPTLVHDPDDKGKEWKLYAYKYFWADEPLHTLEVAQHYGVIAYKYASDPAKEWSTEQWLFSPAPNYPPPPYEGTILLHLNRLDPSLEKVVSYSRPSAVYKDGAILMTLSAFTGGATPDRVIMITSTDHGNSWRYVATPLQKEDLANIAPPDGAEDYTVLSGATLIEQAGQVYLSAVLGDGMQRGRGAFIFAFEDFAKGLLKRDPKTGAPLVIRRVPRQYQGSGAGRIGGGFAAYTDACPFGILTTEQTHANEYKIYKSYIKPAEQK
jgi:hypothetical protein